MSPRTRLPYMPARVDTEALRREHPIDVVVDAYGIELRRVGAALVGRCPFHQDLGRPNLHVYRRSGRWICYRCVEHGDVIRFVQQMENLTFREAAARLGGALSHASHPAQHLTALRKIRQIPPQPTRDIVWGRLEYRVLAAATDLYANELLTHRPALASVANRGFPRELLERYHVGYAVGGGLIP
jgi:DNA primase